MKSLELDASLQIEELRARIDELLRVIEEGGTFEVTHHGKVVGRLASVKRVEQSMKKADADAWAELKRIASELEPYWPAHVDAVQIVREGRREL